MIQLKPFVYDQTIIFGKKGTGKTSLLAKLSYQAHKMGIKVYCTEENIAFTYHIPYDQVGNVWLEENSLLLIDEAATLFNSRDFKTTPKAVRDYFRYSRHNKVKVITFSQSFDDMDYQLRNQATDLYLTSRILPNLSKYRRIEKDICLATDHDGRGIIAESFKKSSIWKKGSIYFCSLTKYRKFFNSYSRLPLPDVKTDELYYNEYIFPDNFIKKSLKQLRSIPPQLIRLKNYLFNKFKLK